MTAKPVVPSESALQDVELAVNFLLVESGEQTALRFVDSLRKGYIHIGLHPASGSPRYAHELNLPGLRHWALSGFPYLIFYMELPTVIDVWRVLHGKRDIPLWMQDLDIS